MKTRNGFVSNSSSSSFVVRRKENGIGGETLTQKQVKALEKFGFRKTFAYCPDHVPGFHDKKEWNKENKFLKKKQYKNSYNYGYELLCNQDDVIMFLIKNQISFLASCHYGHETVMYDSKTDVIYTGHNIGRKMETYGIEYVGNNLDKLKILDKISVVEWIKNNKL